MPERPTTFPTVELCRNLEDAQQALPGQASVVYEFAKQLAAALQKREMAPEGFVAVYEEALHAVVYIMRIKSASWFPHTAVTLRLAFPAIMRLGVPDAFHPALLQARKDYTTERLLSAATYILRDQETSCPT